MLKELVEVKPNQVMEIAFSCATSFSNGSSASTHYCYYGDRYKEVKNTHMDIWTLKDSPKSEDTNLYQGNIPKIYYCL